MQSRGGEEAAELETGTQVVDAKLHSTGIYSSLYR